MKKVSGGMCVQSPNFFKKFIPVRESQYTVLSMVYRSCVVSGGLFDFGRISLPKPPLFVS